MSSRLIDRLGQMRHRQFVGRTAELQLFQSALSASELPCNVIFIYGPGGVGKTLLVSEFAYCAEASGVAVFAYADLACLPDADFTTGCHRFGAYGHDWRKVPPLA